MKDADAPMTECPKCGAPYEARRKFNNGNPREFMFPTCSCAEEEAEARLDAMIDGIEKRRND